MYVFEKMPVLNNMILSKKMRQDYIDIILDIVTYNQATNKGPLFLKIKQNCAYIESQDELENISGTFLDYIMEDNHKYIPEIIGQCIPNAIEYLPDDL
jgi:hypothetical protein